MRSAQKGGTAALLMLNTDPDHPYAAGCWALTNLLIAQPDTETALRLSIRWSAYAIDIVVIDSQ